MPSWMPFWQFYTVQNSPDQLRVVCPPNLVFIAVITLVIGGPLLRWTIGNIRERKMTMAAFLMYLVIYLFCIGLVVSHGTLTLNRRMNIATFHKVHFMYIPTTETIPLDAIQFARAESAPHSDHFIVVTKGGKTYDLVYWTQMSGQGRAANAVNAFLTGSATSETSLSAR